MAMPRWLRYLVSISSGLMTVFTLTVLIAGLAEAADRSADNLGFGLGALVVLAGFFIPAIVMLAINDWLASRYPTAGFSSKRDQDEQADSSV